MSVVPVHSFSIFALEIFFSGWKKPTAPHCKQTEQNLYLLLIFCFSLSLYTICLIFFLKLSISELISDHFADGGNDIGEASTPGRRGTAEARGVKRTGPYKIFFSSLPFVFLFLFPMRLYYWSTSKPPLPSLSVYSCLFLLLTDSWFFSSFVSSVFSFFFLSLFLFGIAVCVCGSTWATCKECR